MFLSLLYLIYLLGIMVCVGIIKDHNLFGGFYNRLSRWIKNKKILVFFYSMVGGILPIPGRCVVSASLLDTIATKDKKKREVFGLIGYLSTHHYYFWSPLEETVILPVAALGLSYLSFLQLIFPLLAVYVIFLLVYMAFFLKEDDIELEIKESNQSALHILPLLLGIVALICGIAPWIVFAIIPFYYIFATGTFDMQKLIGYVNWKLMGSLAVVLILAHWTKAYAAPVVAALGSGFGGMLLFAVAVGWILAFAMGSSSKFAGIVAVFCSSFGVAYLPLFFATEFSAYFLSPTHKCVVISKEYFGTNLKKFYGVLSAVAILIVITGIILTILLV
jgi:uncharacterized protein